MVTEYRIVHGAHLESLSNEVNMRIKDGWIPQGGITMAKSGGGHLYSQAMIKKE